MKHTSLVLLLLTFAMTVAAQKQKLAIFDVRGPMIVAFHPHISEAELRRDPDANEVLSDFQEYARRVRKPLRQRGIDFHEVYARRFGIKRENKTVIFTPGKALVGYYFIAPGKKPRIEYGNTDDGLLQVADEYFGLGRTANPH